MAFRRRGLLQIKFLCFGLPGSAAKQGYDLTRSPGADILDREKWKRKDSKAKKNKKIKINKIK